MVLSQFLKLIRREHLLVLFLLFMLFLTYQFHWLQSWWHLKPPEEVALIILLVTAILWVFETIPLFVTSFMVLLLSLTWLLPLLVSSGIAATKEQFLLAFFSDITLLFLILNCWGHATFDCKFFFSNLKKF